MSKVENGYTLMALSIFLFAINALLMSFVGQQFTVDAWSMNLYRSASGIAVLLLFFAPKGNVQWSQLVYNPMLILRGILGGVGIPLYYFTIIHLGAGKATLVNCTYPLFATLVAWVCLKENINKAQLLFLLLAFLGMSFFLGVDWQSDQVGFVDLLAVIGAVVAGGVVVTIRFLKRTQTSATIYAGQCTYGLIIAVIPFIFISEDLAITPILLLLLGGVVVAFGQICMTQAYQYLSVGTGSATQLLLPIVTAIGSFFLFGESFSMLEVIGGAITLLACWRVVVLASKVKS